ncbi:hypothetical protein AVEN_118746-1 [Araneus ventricosus]|uniref:Uncharacterized protein n=1 Tax=Araneus ventricosus TaxID=182803 RepID=A0A4Y2BVI2_ARAVE|nr:hypothetical protein AVEN_118746-1 [Araneus ventricosus]
MFSVGRPTVDASHNCTSCSVENRRPCNECILEGFNEIDDMKSGQLRGYSKTSKSKLLMAVRLCLAVCVPTLSRKNTIFYNNKPRRLVRIAGFTREPPINLDSCNVFRPN